MPPRRPTQRDIAERAGVSTATVSYVLSGRRGGAKPPPPETRERVLRAVAETGYQLDHAARSLRRQRTDVVAPSSRRWRHRAARSWCSTTTSSPAASTWSARTARAPAAPRSSG
ncbi:LacI family DNA-binding transcriptional regulator [Pseudonocardia hierapolitana]|uniref:LacI family DNA-binding transcriptional regulator n=1 Tax=Pseudonocardia hierapolitana TaxID=1128676 RepID=UPI001BB01EB4|nr:LacI family DNA-binding transcriptional regulator [Pseudonocardia hierapolitana]